MQGAHLALSLIQQTPPPSERTNLVNNPRTMGIELRSSALDATVLSITLRPL